MSESRRRRLGDQAAGMPTMINQGCKINGEISGIGDFVIHGDIVGDCHVKGRVSIADSGSWEGSVRADNVIVAGRLDGDIVANGKVEITTTARISGSVTGEAIAVAEGAVVEGVMQTTGKAEPLEFIEKRES